MNFLKIFLLKTQISKIFKKFSLILIKILSFFPKKKKNIKDLYKTKILLNLKKILKNLKKANEKRNLLFSKSNLL